MINKLNPLQEEYLFEIGDMIAAHTTKENPDYQIAEELEKMGFLKLIESDIPPLIGTVLTDIGKKYVRNKKFMGEEDYQMSNGDWTERYGILEKVVENNLIKGKHTIYEEDETKGVRTAIIDKETGPITRETQ